MNGEINEFNKFHSNLNDFKNIGYKDTTGLSIDVEEINEEKNAMQTLQVQL